MITNNNANSIRTTVKILDIKDKQNARQTDNEDTNYLRNGDTATVVFEFRYRPQFVKVGTRFILAEGKCKMVGKILSI